MNMYSCIFDIGNVLINFDLTTLQLRVAQHSDRTFEEIQASWFGEGLIAVETGRLRGEEFFADYAASTGLRWSYEEWITAWMDSYSLNLPGRELFLNLKKGGMPVYILSNLAEYNTLAIERRFPDFFQESTENFFSYELGLHKPDPRIYRTVCETLRVSPEVCFFFDDMRDNVRSAIATGMKGFHFSNEALDSIQQELEEHIQANR